MFEIILTSFVKRCEYKNVIFKKMIGHMAHFLWNILKLIQNLKTFGEGLNKQKHVHILFMFLALVNKSFAYAKGPSQHNQMTSNS